MNIGCIYCYTDSRNKFKYIGQTNDLDRRHKQHLRDNQIYFDQFINEDTEEYFLLEVIEEVPCNELDEREKYWIMKFNTFKGDGYNMHPGGGSAFGPDHPQTVIGSKDEGVKIYNDYKYNGLTIDELISKYGVSKNTIMRVTNGEHWSTYDLEQYNKRIPTELALEVYNYYHEHGINSYQEVKERFGLEPDVAYLIIQTRRKDLRNLEPIVLDFEHVKGEEHPSTITDKELCLKIYNEYKNEKFKNQQESKEFKINLSNKYGYSLNIIEHIIYAKHWSTKGLEPIKRFNWPKEKSLKIYNGYKNSNITQQELAEKNNISEDSVSRIVNCTHHHTKDMEPINKEVSFPGEANPNSKISKEQGLSIYNQYKKGEVTIKELAKENNLVTETIRQIVYGKHWSTREFKSLRRGKKPKSQAVITKILALKIYLFCKHNNYHKEQLTGIFDVSLTAINEITNANHKYTKHLQPLNDRVSHKIIMLIYKDYRYNDYTQEQLAHKYKVSKSTVYRVIKAEHPYTKKFPPIDGWS